MLEDIIKDILGHREADLLKKKAPLRGKTSLTIITGNGDLDDLENAMEGKDVDDVINSKYDSFKKGSLDYNDFDVDDDSDDEEEDITNKLHKLLSKKNAKKVAKGDKINSDGSYKGRSYASLLSAIDDVVKMAKKEGYIEEFSKQDLTDFLAENKDAVLALHELVTEGSGSDVLEFLAENNLVK
jgi:hypothetical protein